MTDPQEYSQRSHWSVDTRLNVAHLLTTIALVASLFSYVVVMDRRITKVEERVDMQRERDAFAAAQMALLRAEIADLRGELREASRALQRYMERGAR